MNDEPAKKGRGRPKGSTNKPKAPKGPTVPTADGRPAGADHNMPHVAKDPLTEDQQQALFFNHKRSYEKALAVKKKADAEFKVACKLIKSEGTKLSDIKLAVDLEDPEASAEMRARLERELRVARWVGAPVGTQFSLLDETDRTPIDERVFDEGKRAGLKGEKCEPPRTLPGNLMTRWTDGWHEGQTALAGKIKQKDNDQRPEDETSIH
jgi:hypothetical protein